MPSRLVEKIRSDLRLNHSEFDDEIQRLIDTSIEDLKTSGIASSYFKENQYRPMITTAIITYCKANFGYDNQDAVRLQQSYEMQKQKLAISHHDYKELETVETTEAETVGDN